MSLDRGCRRRKCLRKCSFCGAAFNPWRNDCSYCSTRCSNRANAEKKRRLRMKKCSTCLVLLDRSMFARTDRVDRAKYSDACISCSKASRATERAARPWFYRLVTQMICNARNRAEADGVPFSISREDVIVPDKCPVFGFPFKDRSKPDFFSNNKGPSLDRIIGSEGYVPGNIIVVSCRANSLKGNATPDELIKLAEFYRKLTASVFKSWAEVRKAGNGTRKQKAKP